MIRFVVALSLLSLASCKKDPPPAPPPPAAPVGPVTFGDAPLVPGTRITEKWTSELALPVAEGQAVSSIERGAVDIDYQMADGGRETLTLRFGEVSRATGQAAPVPEKASNTVLSFDRATGQASIGTVPADPEVTKLAQERLVPWLQPMALTRSLRSAGAVRGGSNLQVLALAFASDFAAKEKIRGTPGVEVSKIAMTLVEHDPAKATASFSTLLEFQMRDADLKMQVELQGTLVVDVKSGFILSLDLRGPVTMEQPAALGQPATKRTGTWVDTLQRTMVRPAAG